MLDEQYAYPYFKKNLFFLLFFLDNHVIKLISWQFFFNFFLLLVFLTLFTILINFIKINNQIIIKNLVFLEYLHGLHIFKKSTYSSIISQITYQLSTLIHIKNAFIQVFFIQIQNYDVKKILIYKENKIDACKIN